MGNFQDLTDAISELSMYTAAATIDDFLLKAVAGDAVVGTGAGGDELFNNSAQAQILKMITGVQDGGVFLVDMAMELEQFTAPATTGTLSQDALTELFSQFEELAKSFKILTSHEIAATASTGVVDTQFNIELLLGEFWTADGHNAKNPQKAYPSMGIIQILPAALNYAVRDTGAVEIFMNMIPTLEWSKCVPYLDMRIITPSQSVTKDGDGNIKIADTVSQMRFLNGTSIVTGPDKDIASATAMDLVSTNLNNYVANEQAEAAGELDSTGIAAYYGSAGMELFTSPQTLNVAAEQYYNLEAVADLNHQQRGGPGGDPTKPWPGDAGASRVAPVLDRMRPFMTLNSIDIKVVPTRGMMSTKSAEVKITLHDRSRLNEISVLTKPDSFGKTELLIEWGWSHPDHSGPNGNGNTRNPFGKFLNANRVKEKFGVFNSKYAFKDDGQVEITLSCVSRGANAIIITNVGLSDEAVEKYRAFETLVQAVSEFRRSLITETPQLADVAGFSTLSNLSPTNAADLFSGDKAVEIDAFITANRTGEGDASDLADMLEDLKTSASSVQRSIKDIIDAKNTVAKNTQDPYLYANDGDSPRFASKTGIGVTNPADWCSFGRLAALYIAAPLMTTKQYNEIQLIFYCFNNKAGYMYDQNIANFPIPMTGNTGFAKLFEEWVEEKVNVTVGTFIAFMNRYYLTNMASDAYGFGNLFSRDEEGNAKVDESQVSNLSTQKDSILADAYGENAELTFKLPRIRIVPEAVPWGGNHRGSGLYTTENFGPEDTILRLHIYDDAADKYSGLHDIIKAKRNSAMGALRVSAGEASSVDQSNWSELYTQLTTKADEIGLLEKVEDQEGGTGEYFRVKGGVSAMKHFISQNMPTIKFGSQNSAVTSLSMQSMHNPQDTTIHMLRSMRSTGQSPQGAAGAVDRGLPIRMMPIQASGETMGCPLLAHGQQFFIDLGTGTTVDNVYVVSGLDHSITPGEFKTKFKLIPIDAFGAYESMVDGANAALAQIRTLGSETAE